MSNTEQPIPPSEYRTIAEQVPIVSVDLLLLCGDGLLVGRRENAPAKGDWFVPGGTVLKGETRREAVHRVAAEELGVGVTVDEQVGTYDLFFQSAESKGVETKQYVATAFVVTPRQTDFTLDDQHDELTTVASSTSDLHPYIQRYVRELRSRGYLQ